MKKHLVPCILFVTLFTCATKTFSQFVTVPTKISTPYGKVTTYTMRYAPWLHYNNNATFSNQKYKFYILFLNDSLVEAKARINIDDSINTLEWGKKEKKVVIKPTETKEIYRIDNFGKKISGIPHDSCWLFLVDTGRIRTYSVTSDIDFPLIGYIQKGKDEPILPLTKENLLPLVADNEKTKKLVEKEKLLKAINVYNK